ncbi:phosphoenolpyruvate synthase [Clostridium sp. A1-XYC3]|uniref:Phosphoenolpyruvate synthase n=1 Tax=Clostridium tanneri TaxID=3037988 RepID=A0ABU4JTR0_9CLOT|nr:phosphoenolpyruvate synthase [Clostridium sp. A1-XYC3]MDW8801492.1 phosphoenolpyruvate synthase [Clostridium sp. A1-XYC3]
MSSYVLGFQQIDKSKLPVVGGKGANLGELSKIEGISVPEGFCITTEAYKRIVESNEEFNTLVDKLSLLKVDDRETVAELSKKIRENIEEISISKDIVEEVSKYVSKLGEKNAYAVRSSATAEDLPLASFAGQQDTYLNIMGKDEILKHIRKCWASLYTDRAVIYRIQNKFDHHKVYLSVVIQKMVFPEASGIMFTADPITSNRKVTSIDASFGLGEALVSGLVNPDIYKVREGRIIDKKISTKKLAIYALEKGGTEEREIEAGKQNKQTLLDEKIIQLAGMGRKIEAYFGCPQDIEWCLYEDNFYIVQSRPITTLYPIPPETKDGKNHVYISFGHRQMMTEAMKPLGMSFFQTLFKEMVSSTMSEMGGRLYIDASSDISSPFGRITFIKGLDTVDVLMKNALINLTKQKDFIKTLHKGKTAMGDKSMWLKWINLTIKDYRANDPAIVEDLMSTNKALMLELEQSIIKFSGDELFEFIHKSLKQIKNTIFHSYGVVFAGTYASYWLNKNIEKWLGEKNVADTLAQSVSNNVTSEMGLELLDVADVVRQYPAVIEYFQQPKEETFFEDLAKIKGGLDVTDSIKAFLKKYGMRCSAEIDITRTRWNEKPTILVPAILSNIKAFGPNAHSIKFEQGLKDAKQKEKEILGSLEKLSGGKRKARKAKKAISVLRNYAGYREFNKYILIWFEWIIKQAFMREADVLVKKGIIRDREDVYYLTFDELRDVVKTNILDYNIITKRKEDYEVFEKLTPPRVITSEGEIIPGEYNTDNIPEGALAGVPVSSGVVEGRARVVLKMEDANIEEGDILVTTFTDPSWTPLFVSIKGLVTEVGGMMTHGAVVAREYGLPAVVSVENATKLIKDGQRIRINGKEGYVEIL